MDDKPHSAEYFGKQRDFWWNADFLRLMAERWKLKDVKNALDVGCGVGHWGRLMAGILPATAKVTGMDREPKWVEAAAANAAAAGLGGRFTYVRGSAEKMPFPPETFDMVTCQTVLIHVADIKRVITEMLRVLKPGGLLAVAEPNNLVSSLVMSNLSVEGPSRDILDMTRFQLLCELGKAALGEGFNSVGDLVPGYFSELGLEGIQVYMSDKAWPVYPPYASEEQQVCLAQGREWEGREFWRWDKADTKRYFLAGGGTEPELDVLWKKAMAGMADGRKGIDDKKLHTGGGNMIYLVSGRKP